MWRQSWLKLCMTSSNSRQAVYAYSVIISMAYACTYLLFNEHSTSFWNESHSPFECFICSASCAELPLNRSCQTSRVPMWNWAKVHCNENWHRNCLLLSLSSMLLHCYFGRSAEDKAYREVVVLRHTPVWHQRLVSPRPCRVNGLSSDQQLQPAFHYKTKT